MTKSPYFETAAEELFSRETRTGMKITILSVTISKIVILCFTGQFRCVYRQRTRIRFSGRSVYAAGKGDGSSFRRREKDGPRRRTVLL